MVVVGDTYGRVRAMENGAGKRVTKAGPSTAVVLLGLGEVPAAGDILRVVPDEKTARAMIEDRRALQTSRPEGSGRATLEDLYRQIQAGQTKELRIIVKADVQGSLGAIEHALEQIQSDEVRINVIREGTGDISENDIMLASASDAIVIGFNTKLDSDARRSMESEGVEVRFYDIIYRLTEEMQAAVTGMLDARGDRGRRGPRRGAPDLPGRQDQRHRRAATSRTGASSAAAPRLPRRQAGTDRRGSHRVAAALPRRRPRGRHGLRVRHRPGELQRPGGRGHHRVLHAADGVPRRPGVGR